MLAYHPIHDPNHCTFRLLCLMHDINEDEVEWDRLKILDFYVLFPHLIAKITFPKEMRGERKKLEGITEPYENLASSEILMAALGKIQDQTIKSLIAKDIIKEEDFLSGKIKEKPDILPQEMCQLIEEAPFRQEVWYKFLTKQLVNINLTGENGLKHRTGLMEYRYDT